MKSWLVATALAVRLASAQYGQYPPGTYPGQSGAGMPGGGISIPHRSKKGKASPKKDQTPDFKQDGIVISSSSSKLQIGTNDGRRITFTINPDTKYTKTGVSATFAQAAPDTFVHVDAYEDQEWFLTAATVDIQNAPPATTPETKASTNSPQPSVAKPVSSSAAATTADNDNPPPPESVGNAPDDVPGRPHLHRGKPTSQEDQAEDRELNASSEGSEKSQPAINAKTNSANAASDGSIDFTVGDEKTETKRKPSGYDDLIERTRTWSETFSQGLPNFVCQQNTTRYMENSRAEGFEPQDVISAKVIYEDGREQYQQITVGGKRTNKSMLELGGSTSTGEFASTLRSLFSGSTNSQFKFQESSTLGRTAIGIYTFKVMLLHSDWTIKMGDQDLRPAYSGVVWVDKSTSEVRRIEMQADNIPKNYPADTLALTVDYEPVNLGTSHFLLPVHSENLACFRGTSVCSKNTIDFRDYHKYSGESTVEFQ